MSQKNHEITDGRLVQTDKKYSHLKLKQKEKIAEWMFQETRDFYTKKYTFPNDKQLSEVVDKVYEKIEEAGIWVPYGEVLKHYKSKRSNVNKRVKRLFNEYVHDLRQCRKCPGTGQSKRQLHRNNLPRRTCGEERNI